jgi:precorrin-2 dehydrogenase/sirohydrochlorin ferrochelatase
VAAYYPLHLNIEGKKCLVVGGGKTAQRKVSTLLRYGGRVMVVSPEATPAIVALSQRKKIVWKKREFREPDCTGAFLIFSATDCAHVNRTVARMAYRKSILVNVADSLNDCDFISPALVERGHLTVSIATEGLAPFLSGKIKTDLERYFGPAYMRYTLVMGKVRGAIVRNRKLTEQAKRKKLQLLLSLPIIGKLARGEKIYYRDILKKLGVTD